MVDTLELPPDAVDAFEFEYDASGYVSRPRRRPIGHVGRTTVARNVGTGARRRLPVTRSPPCRPRTLEVIGIKWRPDARTSVESRSGRGWPTRPGADDGRRASSRRGAGHEGRPTRRVLQAADGSNRFDTGRSGNALDGGAGRVVAGVDGPTHPPTVVEVPRNRDVATATPDLSDPNPPHGPPVTSSPVEVVDRPDERSRTAGRRSRIYVESPTGNDGRVWFESTNTSVESPGPIAGDRGGERDHGRTNAPGTPPPRGVDYPRYSSSSPVSAPSSATASMT